MDQEFIASHLTEKGVLTPTGKTSWRETTIKNILQNEKYKGEALLQKDFTVDFLTKKRKKNEGEVKQYYVKKQPPGDSFPGSLRLGTAGNVYAEEYTGI